MVLLSVSLSRMDFSFDTLNSHPYFLVTDPETGEAAYKFKRGDM